MGKRMKPVREVRVQQLTLVPVRRRRQVVAWVILSAGGQPLALASSEATARQAAEFLVAHR